MPTKLDKIRNKPIDKTHEKTLKIVAKGAGIVFIGTIVGYFFSYITRLLIARWLGPSDYGLYNLGLAIFSICATISLLGLSEGVTRYISFLKVRRDLNGVKGVIHSSIKISLPISIFFSILLYVFSVQISIFFHNLYLASVLQVFSIGIPFYVLFTIFVASLRGFKKTKYKVYSQDIFYPTLKIILISSFLYLGFNLFGAIIGYVLSIIIGLVLAFFYLNKTFPIFNSIKKRPITKELLLFSLPLLFSTLLGSIVGWTDTAMLGFFKTSLDVGIYNAAHPTVFILLIVLNSFGFIFLPIISELYSKGKDIKKIYKAVTRWIFALNLPIFLLMILFPKVIIKILFGHEYLSAALPLAILSIGYFTHSLILSYNILTSIGKTKINLLVISIGACSNFILNLILIPIYGVVGASIATSTSIILLNISSLTFLYHYLKIHPFSLSLIKPLISSIIPMTLFYSIYRYFNLEIWFLFPMFIGFLLIYIINFLLMKGLNQEDLLILKSMEKKTGLRINWLRKLVKRFS